MEFEPKNLVKMAARFDELGHAAEADQADELLMKYAQMASRNPVQQQMQTLMFQVNQLNNRLKNIEQSIGNQNAAIKQPTQPNPMALEQSVQQAVQNTVQNNPEQNTYTHDVGDYQVTVEPQL